AAGQRPCRNLPASLRDTDGPPEGFCRAHQTGGGTRWASTTKNRLGGAHPINIAYNCAVFAEGSIKRMYQRHVFQEIPTRRPNTPLLDRIDTPAQLRLLPEEQLPQLAHELRSYLLYSVGQSGGHFGAGLGV